MAGMGLMYFVLAAVYAIPLVPLYRFAGSIRLVEEDRDFASLEISLSHQRGFWKTIGILTAVVIALYVVVIVGAIAVGIIMGVTR